TLRQKWRQMRLAWALERTWSKEQILETYLNLASFRGELEGVGAATDGLLGKAPHGVSGPEALVLAALLAAPNAPASALARRAPPRPGTARGRDRRRRSRAGGEPRAIAVASARASRGATSAAAGQRAQDGRRHARRLDPARCPGSAAPQSARRARAGCRRRGRAGGRQRARRRAGVCRQQRRSVSGGAGRR